MGMRLSLDVLPKDVAKKLWLVTDYDDYHDLTYNLERIVYDFCTDAMWDIEADKELKKKMKRLTKSKLGIEDDIVLGKMDKEGFMVFMTRVKWYAERQIRESDNPLQYWDGHYETENPWRLLGSIDWLSAYYECWFILKKMDWENNYILYEIG